MRQLVVAGYSHATRTGRWAQRSPTPKLGDMSNVTFQRSRRMFLSRNITMAIELPPTRIQVQTQCCCKHAKGTKLRSDCIDSSKQEMLQIV
jgi:hypothetical protein